MSTRSTLEFLLGRNVPVLYGGPREYPEYAPGYTRCSSRIRIGSSSRWPMFQPRSIEALGLTSFRRW